MRQRAWLRDVRKPFVVLLKRTVWSYRQAQGAKHCFVEPLGASGDIELDRFLARCSHRPFCRAGSKGRTPASVLLKRLSVKENVTQAARSASVSKWPQAFQATCSRQPGGPPAPRVKDALNHCVMKSRRRRRSTAQAMPELV